ncbi:MAG: GDSL-type esterase/lipase family protein [Bacteroidales bacterium]|jgi:lysophospholipase L1-like esterase|nr:GDSL-type esterase/lipase family protein [Bacteroidales bacterium]
MKKNKSKILYKLLIINVLSVSILLNAQSVYQPVLPYSCLHTVDNLIYYPSSDSTTYDAFFSKLDRLLFQGKGKVTILHLGGSHIQAGVWSGQVRKNLLSLCPGIVGSRGLIFPFSAAKTNNPSNYITTSSGNWDMCKNTQHDAKYPMGLSGISLATTDPNAKIAIKMRNKDGILYNFTTVWLLATCESDAIIPVLSSGEDEIEGDYYPEKMAYLFEFKEPIDSFSLSFHLRDNFSKPFILRGFWLDNHLNGLTYVDIGVNGAKLPSYLRCQYLENDLKFVKPDLVILSIGVNDAHTDKFDTLAFQTNYKSLISRIRSVSPNCAILFTTNNDTYRKASRRSYVNNVNGYWAQQSFYSLARYYHTGVWDLFDFMGGLTSIKNWQSDGLARPDRVHFTASGYLLLGDALYNAIVNEYVNYLQRKRKRLQ